MQPPATPAALGEPLYEAFYGLNEQPFALSTDPRFLFLSASHRRVYEELLTGLRRREGLLLLTGETGTGKTTLCRAVIEALGQRTFGAIILNPYMSGPEVLRVILRDFGLVSREEIRRGALSRADMPQLLDTLESFLRSLLPLDSYAVLVVDEAQSLAPPVLDQLRMLGGYEQDGHRLLQIVLVGQPALADVLKTEPMRAVNERITRRTALSPLQPVEVEEYIRHRLAVAGAKDNVRFLPDAVLLVADRSRGLPRRINMLCDRALEEGRVDGKNLISAELVKRAALSVAGAAAPPPADRETTAAPAAEPAAETPAVEAAPAGSLEGAPEAAPAIEIPLSFGAQPESRRRGGRVVAAAAAIVLVISGAIWAGSWAWGILSKDPGIPPFPRAPKLNTGQAPPPKPVPSDEDMKTMFANTPAGRDGGG